VLEYCNIGVLILKIKKKRSGLARILNPLPWGKGKASSSGPECFAMGEQEDRVTGRGGETEMKRKRQIERPI